MLELRNITRAYELGGERAGVFEVSLHVPAGTLAVLAGPSGSGKTTLLQVAGLLDTADEGEVLLEGRAVSSLPERERCQVRLLRLGFVFQTFNLVPVLSALENVMLPLQLQGVAERPARDQAQKILERVGLGDRLRHRPGQLSGGQQQRTAIARALVSDPILVLADEPTANLDHAHGGPLMELIAELSRERGVSFLAASHDPAVIGKADLVFRLKDGRLEGGPHPGGVVILPRLALRNVLRQKRRTLLTLLVLVAGYVALALAGGFMAQTFQGLADAAIRGGIGHVQILPAGGLEGDEGQSLEHALPDGEALAAALRKDPAVAEVLPRIQFMGLASNGTRSVAFLGTAVDAAREPRFMAIADRLTDGAKAPGGSGPRWLNADPTAREVVLGMGLAKGLGVKVGDSLTLMSTTPDGALNAVDVEVAGLQDLGLRELNDRSLCVSLDTASTLLNAGPARSRLSVLLRHPEDAEREGPRLAGLAGGGVEAHPWFELASFYRQVKLLYFAIFGFMGLVLALVVLLATVNTLLMSVMERLRELGLFRAVGMRPTRLLALLQWEGAMLGLAGSALGLAITLILRFALNALHLQMPAPPGTSHGYELNIHLVPMVYLGAFLGLQAVIQVSAFFPGLKAARIRITEALRHV